MFRHHARWIVGLVITLSLVTFLSPTAQAAIPLYLKLTIGGQEVEGGVDVAGREGSCEVVYFEQMTSLSVEGRPQYTLIFQKSIDSASPDITKAILEQLPVVAKFRFYKIDPTGTETNYYTIDVSGQIVSSMLMCPNVKDPAFDRQVHTERVTMVIRSISWTFVPDNEKVSSGSSKLIR